jgi:hypothetical protein
LRGNHPCFLEEPQWQDVIFSKPSDSILESEWVDSWQVLPMMCLIPRLVTDCREIIQNQSSKVSEEIFEERISSLFTAADDLRHSLMNLAERYGWQAERYSPVLAPRSPGDSFRVFCDHEDQRTANFGNYLSAVMLINRILIAIRPSMQWLEQKNRTYALEIQYLHSFLKSHEQLREYFLIHSERVALAILLTSGYWSGVRGLENASAHDPNTSDGGKLIDPWKWNLFDDILTAKSIDAPLMYVRPSNFYIISCS